MVDNQVINFQKLLRLFTINTPLRHCEANLLIFVLETVSACRHYLSISITSHICGRSQTHLSALTVRVIINLHRQMVVHCM